MRDRTVSRPGWARFATAAALTPFPSPLATIMSSLDWHRSTALASGYTTRHTPSLSTSSYVSGHQRATMVGVRSPKRRPLSTTVSAPSMRPSASVAAPARATRPIAIPTVSTTTTTTSSPYIRSSRLSQSRSVSSSTGGGGGGGVADNKYPTISVTRKVSLSALRTNGVLASTPAVIAPLLRPYSSSYTVALPKPSSATGTTSASTHTSTNTGRDRRVTPEDIREKLWTLKLHQEKRRSIDGMSSLTQRSNASSGRSSHASSPAMPTRTPPPIPSLPLSLSQSPYNHSSQSFRIQSKQSSASSSAGSASPLTGQSVASHSYGSSRVESRQSGINREEIDALRQSSTRAIPTTTTITTHTSTNSYMPSSSPPSRGRRLHQATELPLSHSYTRSQPIPSPSKSHTRAASSSVSSHSQAHVRTLSSHSHSHSGARHPTWHYEDDSDCDSDSDDDEGRIQLTHSDSDSVTVSVNSDNDSDSDDDDRASKYRLESPAVLRRSSYYYTSKPTIAAIQTKRTPLAAVEPITAPLSPSPSPLELDHSPLASPAIIRKRAVGLVNLGNTCFFNSALQCLLSIPSLYSFFASRAYESDLNGRSRNRGSVAKAMAKLCDTINHSHTSFVSPSSLLQSFVTAHPLFSGYGQHDAQEALRCLLDSLHEDLNRVTVQPKYESLDDNLSESDSDASLRWWKNNTDRNDSHCSELFTGQLKSTLQCLACKRTSRAFDPFWDLQLPIPTDTSSGSEKKSSSRFKFFSSSSSSTIDSLPSPSQPSSAPTLENCLSLFLQRETLVGNDQIYCSQCKQLQDHTKQLSVVRSPPVLVFQLKKFAYNPVTGDRKKLNVTIDFSERLTMHSIVYQLQAVSCHSGGTHGGHYTAYTRLGEQWVDCNDSHTSVVSVSEVLGCSAAYLLFYQRVSH